MNQRARLLMFAIGISVVGCREEGDKSSDPDPALEAAWQRPYPEPVRAHDRAIARSLGDGFELRRPIRAGRLTLIPIVATRAAAEPRYLTLVEGLSSGAVEITESGGLVVDTLLVRNGADRPLFVLQGELLIDGMQDRVIATTAIIAAGETAPLTVRCVEHNRSEGAPGFHAAGAIVELGLRRTIAHEFQNDVWDHVDAINRRQHLAPATRSYRLAAAALAQGDNAVRRSALYEQLLRRREEHAQRVGFAVAIDGELVALDWFATPALFHQLEYLLLASYLAGTEGRAPERPAIEPAAVRLFAASPLAVETAASTIVLTQRSEAEKRAAQL